MSSSPSNENWIDGSLYPDQDAPHRIETLAERIDFLARLCGAWDFGVLPWPATLRRVLQPDWTDAVCRTQLLTSCAYLLLRELHRLPPARYMGPRFPEIESDPCLAMV